MRTSLGEAIVLAGGLGKRLRSAVSDVPKPMAPMDDKGTPFLSLVLDFLVRQGITHIVLSVGYMADVIYRFFGNRYKDIPIDYKFENKPLGTGGAVKAALDCCQDNEVFVLNGDTYFDVNLSEMMRIHQETMADFTLAAREMHNFDRYGTLQLDAEGRILSFAEKKFCEQGYINGGIYYLRKNLLDDISDNMFSLEKDFLERELGRIWIQVYLSDGYFIDIGIPEDYRKAKLHWKS